MNFIKLVFNEFGTITYNKRSRKRTTPLKRECGSLLTNVTERELPTTIAYGNGPPPYLLRKQG